MVMQEQQHEKLSLFVDDQLDRRQAADLLKTMRTDPELQARFQRYQLISQALKSDQCSVARPDFSARVREQLKSEPSYLLPKTSQHGNWRNLGLAVAASVLVAVVWVAAKVEKPVPAFAGGNTVAQNSARPDAMNAQFNEYLQAHDNAWYVNNNVGGQAYARLTAYQQQ